MKNWTLFFLVAIFIGTKTSFAFPVSMDIGSFAIDNYDGNGDGMLNLSYMIASGQNFFWAANYNVPGYAGSNTSTPTMALNAPDGAVTKAAITNTSSNYGSREYCDFVYYGGHGLTGSMFLGNADPPYGQVYPNQMNLGVGYNRWFLANSCSLFNGGTPATVWQPAFKGLKAMLGFKSFVFDNTMSWDLYNTFWYDWTYGQESLLNSFFDAEVNYGYKHLYPSKGLEPGCLSAQVPSSRIDYCREAFKYADHNYTAAAANTGYYYYKVIGSPQY